MPGTTPNGLPYPNPTDYVKDGADDIRRLAEAVDLRGITATAQGKRVQDDLAGAGVVAQVTSVVMSGRDLTGQIVLVIGVVRWRVQGTTDVRFGVNLDGTEIAGIDIASAPALGHDTVTTLVGVGVAVSAHPTVQLRALSADAAISLRNESRVIGIGGLTPPIG